VITPLLRFVARAGAVCLVLLAMLVCIAAAPAAAADGWKAPLTPVTVTRAFMPPPTPYSPGHRGVDLAGRPGEEIVAASDGQVSYAASLAGRGVVVVVHGSLRTTYEPVTAMVRRGSQVTRGQQIGVLEAGHAGCPVSACLHWGLRRGEQYLDPMATLVRAEIRLLPLLGAGSTGSVAGNAVAVSSAGVTPTASRASPALSPAGPSPVTWSLAALAGGGLMLALRRR
jgi:murein DD-endopeptidase MepM/ murein hydrolase activator NlpD